MTHNDKHGIIVTWSGIDPNQIKPNVLRDRSFKMKDLNDNQNATLTDITTAINNGETPSMGDFNVRTLKALCKRGYISLADNTISLSNGEAPAPKSAPVVEDDDSEDGEPKRSSLAETMAKYRAKYKDSKCGDSVSNMLGSLLPADVMVVAEHLLDLEAGTLVERYSSLNNGQMKMNASNLIRGAINRGDITEDDVTNAF